MRKILSKKIKNWSQYNRSLVNRGNLTLWFSDEAVENWGGSKVTPGRGRAQKYSDQAIECCLVLRSVFHLTLRQTQGFVESLMLQMRLNLPVPDYTLLSKRASLLNIDLKALKSAGSIDIVVDSTGLKIFGEGEWKIRTHGKSKRRTWKKLHLAIDPNSHEILGIELTKSNSHDCESIDKLIPNDRAIGDVCADGAYDNEKSYDAVVKRGGIPLIPPRSGAACSLKNPSQAMAMRNHNIKACWAIGRKNWKLGSGYHKRSNAETGMYRFKIILGEKLRSKTELNQVTEARVKSQILNRMTQMGMPKR